MLKRLFASLKHPYMPGLDTPERIVTDLSGSKLILELPPHYCSSGFEEHKSPVPSIDFYNSALYPKETVNSYPFSNTTFIGRDWEIYGPIWKSGYEGSISFRAVVDRANCLPDGMSCFNPNHFEQVITRQLFRMGPEKPNFGEQLAPVNWRVENKGSWTLTGTPWISYEVHKKPDGDPTSFAPAQYSSYIVTPLDDRHYLRLMFHNLGYLPAEYSNRFADSVRDQVYRSIDLTLSASASRQQEAALAKWPDARISKHREPENWQYPDWRDGDSAKGEPTVVITRYRTPIPTFEP